VKQATTLSTVANTVDITAALQGDDAVGADICTTSAQAFTIALANYDFKVPGTTLRRGDTLWCTLTLLANDTGGTVNTAAQCTRLWAVLAVES
jgi:hypothetical protein